MRHKWIRNFFWGQTNRKNDRKEGEKKKFQTNHINVSAQPSVLSVTKCQRLLLCGAAFLCIVEDVVNLLACRHVSPYSQMLQHLCSCARVWAFTKVSCSLCSVCIMHGLWAYIYMWSKSRLCAGFCESRRSEEASGEGCGPGERVQFSLWSLVFCSVLCCEWNTWLIGVSTVLAKNLYAYTHFPHQGQRR